jgi:hypothetical protein
MCGVHRLDDAGRAALFTEARAANAFTDTLVPDRTLRAIWQLARWGYFLLAARAHGLAVGPMAGFDTDGVTAESFRAGATARCWRSTSATRPPVLGTHACPGWTPQTSSSSNDRGHGWAVPESQRRRRGCPVVGLWPYAPGLIAGQLADAQSRQPALQARLAAADGTGLPHRSYRKPHI